MSETPMGCGMRARITKTPTEHPFARNDLALCSRGLHLMVGENAELVRNRFRPDSVRCRACHNAQRRDRYTARKAAPSNPGETDG